MGHGKTAGKTAESPERHLFRLFSGVPAVFPAVLRLFYRDPLGTLFGCFSAVFNLGHLAPLQVAAEIAMNLGGFGKILGFNIFSF